MPEETEPLADKVLDAKDNDTIVRNALQLFKLSADASEEERVRWIKEKNLYEGRHWTGVQWSEERSQVTVNLTRSFVEATVAALTDNRPAIFVQSRDQIDSKLAEDLEHALSYIWDAQDLDIKLPKTVRGTVVLGNYFQKVLFNPHIRQGSQRGMIEVHPVSPFAMYPDPEANCFENARYVAHIQDLPYDWLLENYPDLAEDIPAGDWDLALHSMKYKQQDYDGVVPVAGTTGSGAAGWLMPFERGSGEKMKGLGQRLRVMELFLRETANVIRRLLLANGRVLENEVFGVPNVSGGIRAFREFPFVHYVYTPLEWSFWAEGLVRSLEGHQLELNKVRSLILDHILWGLFSPWIIDKEAQVDVQFDNGPNSKIYKMKEGQVRREPPAAMGNEVFHVSDMIRFEMEMITGHVEVLQGRRPVGIEAARALEIMQEQANTRLRQHARHLEYSTEKLGELLIDFIAAYWTEPRMIRMLGPDGKRAYKMLNGLDVRGHEYDVDIKAGSTLPFSRAQMMSEAVQLAQIGAFGPPGSSMSSREVLKARNWPDWEKIIEELATLEQQAQAAAAEQPPPPPPGPA